ncbi:hypothetical protein GY45DRAFT_65539 [Cubamyces sp. BRFM 1775]|nr:hypothetical protein GY45DRAFT_65539 [Cubamyces sp. BRFM 1775]
MSLYTRTRNCNITSPVSKTTSRRLVLSDTQTRLSVLESELSRLRPLLSMQATLLRDPDLWRSQELSGLVADRIAAYARKWKGKERATHPADTIAPADCLPNTTPSQCDALTQSIPTTIPDSLANTQQVGVTKPPPTTDVVPPPPPDPHKSDRHHRHRKDRDRDRDKDRKYRHRYQPGKPLLADARAECILAAARKIGRARAGVLSGLVKERAQLEREADVLAQNAQSSSEHQDSQHALLSPPTSQPRPSIAGGSTTQMPYDGQAGSSSPPVPLAASYQLHGRGHQAQRRLAPSPFPAPAQSLSFARASNLPTHLHPSGHTYASNSQSGHPHTVSAPGYMYFAPGPGQSAPVPYVVPVAWGVPGTPTAPPAGPSRQRQGDEHPQAESSSSARTPARRRTNSATEGASTPMDSLVNAARSLIEDEDYDDERDAVPAGVETDTLEEDAGADETPVRRRGTRRRGSALAPESPVPKRRRVGELKDDLTATSHLQAGPSAARSSRKGKANAPPQEKEKEKAKPKPRARAKGKGKEKALMTSVPRALHPSAHAEHPAALAPSYPSTVAATPPRTGPTRAPPVTRIRSALDVLADQAAQEQERRPSIGPASRRDSESESREAEEGVAEHDNDDTMAVRVATRSPTPTPTPAGTATASIAVDGVFVAEQVFATEQMCSPLPHAGGESPAEDPKERNQGSEDATGDPSAAVPPDLHSEPEPEPEPEPEHTGRPDVSTPLLPVADPELEAEEAVATELPHEAPPRDSPPLVSPAEERRTPAPSEQGNTSTQAQDVPLATAAAEPGVAAQGEDMTQGSVGVVDVFAEPPGHPPPPPPPQPEPEPEAAAADPELESGDEDAEGSIDEEVDHVK